MIEHVGRSAELVLLACVMSNRGDRIRTYDLFAPNEALYQAELHPACRKRL